MSGGHFNNNGYVYYNVYQFADELENNIENNLKEDDYGYKPGYSEEVITYLKSKVEDIRKMSDLMKAIDYLYSGDYGEDSFFRAVKKIDGDYIKPQ